MNLTYNYRSNFDKKIVISAYFLILSINGVLFHFSLPKLNRFIMLFLGLFMVVVSIFLCRLFMTMKLPGYLKN